MTWKALVRQCKSAHSQGIRKGHNVTQTNPLAKCPWGLTGRVDWVSGDGMRLGIRDAYGEMHFTGAYNCRRV